MIIFFSAIERATGDYIAISDQDDVWELDKLEKQINMIGSNLLCFCFSIPFSDTVKINIDLREPNFQIERMLYISTIPGHTMLFKKHLVSLIPNIQKYSQIFVYDFLVQIVAAAYDSIVFCANTKVNHRRFMEAVTYTKPENYSKSVLNLFYNVRRTFLLYKELRLEIKRRLKNVYEMLSLLPNSSKNKISAMKLAKYHMSNSLFDFLLLERHCIKCRDKLFYAKEKNRLLAVLRALYFPISCSDYFRYLSNDCKK